MKSGIPTYESLNSKKRVFSEGSSVDPDVVEISPPPVNRSSKSKALKIEEVTNQEIIDVDMDENHGIIFSEGKADNKYKGKRAARINTLVARSTSNYGSVDGYQSSKKASAPGSQNIVNLDGFGSNLSYLDDDYVDKMYYDCMKAFDDSLIHIDEHAIMQSHIYNIDIPSGFKAPVSWFPGLAQSISTLATTGSSNRSILKLQPSPNGFLPGLGASHSLWSVDSRGRKSTTSSSTMETPVHAVSHPHKGGPSSLWSSVWPAAENAQRSGWAYNNKATFSGYANSQSPHNPPGSIEQYYGVEPAYGSASFHNNTKKTVGDNSFLSGPHMHNASEAYSVNANGFNLDNSVFSMGSLEYTTDQNSSTTHKNATNIGIPSSSIFRSQKNATDLGIPSGLSSRRQESATAKHVHEDEILKKFQEFKNFDIVEDPSDHHYVQNGTSAKQPSKSWTKKILEEWKILEKDLPDTIFVRVYESRMDLLRAVIVGAQGTPYHDGLFFFDVFFPDNYPNVPPNVYYHSRGLRLNPNMYASGKVCLSLLNTWRGGHKEMWIPELSTMLQVLVSIQGLILNAKPYFNKPGLAYTSRTHQAEKNSQQYNEITFVLSLKTMVFTLRKQPKHFEDFVVGHFFKRAREYLVACKAYMDGAQVGCLVSGGVQDVDEGDKSCSKQFKTVLRLHIKQIVDAFTEIGVKDCIQFIPPAKTGNKQTKSGQIGNRLMSPALKVANHFS